MRKLALLMGGIITAGVLAEYLLGPGILLFVGLAVLFLLWGAQGGMSEGNPYKRMHYTNVPDHLEVRDLMRKEDIETRDNANAQVTIFVFLIGMALILIDISYMWMNGWF